MLPPVSAFSTIAVLPRPWLWVALASPAPCAVCLMISPRMYDSVKRLEPTLSDGAANNEAQATIAASPSTIEAEIRMGDKAVAPTIGGRANGESTVIAADQRRLRWTPL